MNTRPRATNLYNPNSTFVSPIYTFSLAANRYAYTPNQSKNKEKCFYHNIYEVKASDSIGK